MAKRIQKILFLFGVSLLIFRIGVASADFISGSYVGLQLGGSWTPYDLDPFVAILSDITHTKVQDSGYAGHINIGYSFTKYLSSEIGYQYISIYKISAYKKFPQVMHGEISWSKYYFDLSAKLILPIYNFGLFLKPGVAIVHRSAIRSSGAMKIISPEKGSAKTQFSYLLGVGMMYSWNSNLSFDASITAYPKTPYGDKEIDGVLFAGVGIAYKF